MGSIKMSEKYRAFGLFLIFVFSSASVYASSPSVSLSAEIFRLQTIASGSSANSHSALERHNAFMSLARLHRLSGNAQGTLAAFEGALSLFPADGRTLLEYGRFLVSVGEYERAAASVAAFMQTNPARDSLIEGWHLAAEIEAFGFGNLHHLSVLAAEGEFAHLHSGILYTLWRLSGSDAYRARLVSSFPQSPEALIAAGQVSFAATPLWILFPGRDSIALAPQAASPPIAASPPQAVSTPTASPSISGRFLQAGLFSQEVNARTFAEQLTRAGFNSHVITRNINGRNHWAVGVGGGNDENAMLRSLQAAGFQAFPVQQ